MSTEPLAPHGHGGQPAALPGSDATAGGPAAATLAQFIATVEAGDTLAALARFYAPDACTQENQGPPRCGRDTLIAHEQRALASVQQMRMRCIHPVLMAGDRVVIRWRIHYQTPGGEARQIEELAYQRWQGEQIIHEQFFYDPAQLRQTPDPGTATN
ncbi:nuclear transport factor 2 family protein [Aquabacterium sp. OR-4]|uniref:nuclear transport factor 2 family protein n=1 Tax=Aquabacterium sp. OR-4 TaxID=2978127 RepID=UPI0021B45024|nr:nuclear transport factor 2 family protein [Aquabacterium sp. OR-4]MDT7837063.1 nuclear transport factor 2 family protein [Aquabacterium sp. OR-4]